MTRLLPSGSKGFSWNCMREPLPPARMTPLTQIFAGFTSASAATQMASENSSAGQYSQYSQLNISRQYGRIAHFRNREIHLKPLNYKHLNGVFWGGQSCMSPGIQFSLRICWVRAVIRANSFQNDNERSTQQVCR